MKINWARFRSEGYLVIFSPSNVFTIFNHREIGTKEASSEPKGERFRESTLLNPRDVDGGDFSCIGDCLDPNPTSIPL